MVFASVDKRKYYLIRAIGFVSSYALLFAYEFLSLNAFGVVFLVHDAGVCHAVALDAFMKLCRMTFLLTLLTSPVSLADSYMLRMTSGGASDPTFSRP